MKNALRTLLNNLDKVAQEHLEIHDTVVRENMGDVVYSSLVLLEPAFPNPEYPNDYGLFSDDGNDKVHHSIIEFLSHPEVVAARDHLPTQQERLDAFQDYDVASESGT